MRRALRVSMALAVATGLECGAAGAQDIPSLRERDSDTTRRSAAAALFQEGRARMEAGAVSEACERFAESDRLEPAAGTKLNLADCYEHEGRLASAWIAFGAAESDARRLGRTAWVTIAKTRAQLLAPRLPRLKLVLAGPEHGADEVRIDATKLGSAALETPIPVDPGPHEIEAFAGDVRVFLASVTAEVGLESTVTILPSSAPPSPPSTSAAPAAKPTPAPSSGALRSDDSRSRLLPLALLGLGVGGVAMGAITGVVALKENSRANTLCPTPSACGDEDAIEQSNAAHRNALISDVAFIAAGALVATGTALLFLHGTPAADTPHVAFAPVNGGLLIGAEGAL
jgi:hypothetical protein